MVELADIENAADPPTTTTVSIWSRISSFTREPLSRSTRLPSANDNIAGSARAASMMSPVTRGHEGTSLHSRTVPETSTVPFVDTDPTGFGGAANTVSACSNITKRMALIIYSFWGY